VYHPGSPAGGDKALSWDISWAPYIDPDNYTNAISNAPDNTFEDGMITAIALERIARLATETKANGTAAKPFFMAVGLHKPHIPWVMPQRFLDMQPPENTTDTAIHGVPPIGYTNVSLYQCTNVDKQTPYDPLPIETQQKNRRLYRAAMSWTDHNMGLILGALDHAGFSDTTVVTFIGDHGWHLGERGLWCKQSVFDLVARIPFMIHVPWMPASQGTRTLAFAEAVDLFPTLLALNNIEEKVWDLKQLEGSSLVPVLANPLLNATAGGWKNATFSQYPRCKSKRGIMPWVGATDNPCTAVANTDFDAMGYTIRVERWRYTIFVKWTSNKTPDWTAVVGEELYDHLNDTGFDTDFAENDNVVAAPENAELKAELYTALRAGWKAALPKASQ